MRLEVNQKNNKKILFTPGPGALTLQNLEGLGPAFGRGDSDYDDVENRVLGKILEMSGQEKIVRMQGSASLAIEIGIRSFVYGRVLCVLGGAYSNRLKTILNLKSLQRDVSTIDYIGFEEIDLIENAYDWIVSCYVETSIGIKVPIEELSALAARCNSKLFLDATASIGLEDGHNKADVIAFSSCKGLFGLTGAAFICYNAKPSNTVDSFYMNLFTHEQKLVTGPYHQIQSLDKTLQIHAQLRASVKANKFRALEKFRKYLPVEDKYQPLLCTRIQGELRYKDHRCVRYIPRVATDDSIVCHLGELHLGLESRGDILDCVEVVNA